MRSQKIRNLTEIRIERKWVNLQYSFWGAFIRMSITVEWVQLIIRNVIHTNRFYVFLSRLMEFSVFSMFISCVIGRNFSMWKMFTWLLCIYGTPNLISHNVQFYMCTHPCKANNKKGLDILITLYRVLFACLFRSLIDSFAAYFILSLLLFDFLPVSWHSML